ncbi:DUF4118 domain-containing protein [Microlunatus soli]|uniref:Sensor protein KdpD transmembrane domain-containing protein n=1 Tax=Microlunatus soli TaxID=630515 RepID=A0A1H1YYW8_9ACTN|nr:DUF4118 domain-containing protein [Microlunatus soli]SDT26537.1 hypothetical protein SAMN04489812_4866 [Microlunatus soli]
MNPDGTDDLRRPAGTSAIWVAALAGPPVVAGCLIPLRGSLDPTNVALVLVVCVVAVAAAGRRSAGLAAAMTAGLAFDVLWAPPLYRLTIDDPQLIQTAALLVVVGAMVSELAWIGQGFRQRSARSRGYLAGAVDVAATAGAEQSPADRIRLVQDQVGEILDADSCGYSASPAPPGASAATIEADGTLLINGHPANLRRTGLPTDRPIDIEVTCGGRPYGRLIVIAATRWSRPTKEQLQVAALMACQLGAVLDRHQARQTPGSTGIGLDRHRVDRGA